MSWASNDQGWAYGHHGGQEILGHLRNIIYEQIEVSKNNQSVLMAIHLQWKEGI